MINLVVEVERILKAEPPSCDRAIIMERFVRAEPYVALTFVHHGAGHDCRGYYDGL